MGEVGAVERAEGLDVRLERVRALRREQDGRWREGEEGPGGDVMPGAAHVVEVRVREAHGVGVDASLRAPPAVERDLELREDDAGLLPADADALDLVTRQRVHHVPVLSFARPGKLARRRHRLAADPVG